MAKKKTLINVSHMLDNRVYDGDFLAIPNISKSQKNNDPDNLYQKLNSIALIIQQSNIKRTTVKYNISAPKQKHQTNSQNTLYLNGWVRMNTKGLIPRNFGDDINFSFLPNITECKHLLYKQSLYNKETNYLMIGSILTDKFINPNTIVWGSGMLRKKLLKKKPQNVCAVRGPLTRNVLLESGINCPEIYGDPALLIPYYYYPYIQKKYKLGIIPHWSHINSPLVKKFKNEEDVKVIDFKNYTDWKSVIKQIVSCEFIVSESLHGLIISEAFNIPNIWITFGDIGQDFKYEDFFRSVGKPPYNAYKITNDTTKAWLMNLETEYNSINTLNLKNLVNACPVKLNNINIDNKIKKYNGKVLLCCIGKMENLYIREFVEYHKQLGFDNICLYDNNDPDGEHFEDVIGDYIKSGYVILKDVRGKKLAQMPSYTQCYNEYKDKYDWIAFIDIDEFIHLDNGETIKSFLSKDIFNINGVNCVRLMWKQFDDSEILKPNGNYSVKKFKTFLPMKRSDCMQTKPILKTCLDNVEFTSAHGPVKDPRVKCVNTAGEPCSNSITSNKPTWTNACLNHYRFKTIEEFVLGKMVRLWPTHYKNGGKSALNLNMFFRYNKKTKEKVAYAEKLLKEHNINRNEG